MSATNKDNQATPHLLGSMVWNPQVGQLSIVHVITRGLSCLENDYCDPDPCQNGGRCFNSDGGYRCHCTLGFVGFHCESENES